MNQYTATPVHPASPLSRGERSYDLNGNLVQIGCDCTPYGDVFPVPDGNGIVDLSDVLCVLDGFGNPALCRPSGDIFPCGGNGGIIDLNDVLAVLDAFAGIYACPATCGYQGPVCLGNPVRIAYDYRNRMTEWNDLRTGRRHTYSYDAFGRRIKKVVDVDGASRGLQPARSGAERGSAGPIETRYFYGGPSQWQVIEEQNAGGNTVATYVYGNYIDDLIHMRRCLDEPAACTPNSSQISYYFHADENFNVMAVTGSTGTVVERYEYDDYGRPQFFDGSGTLSLQESAIGNPYLFTGREYDAETGLYYYRTRYLDPVAGRFTTRDTIGLWGDPNELGNGYSLLGDNPWSWLDPFGLCKEGEAGPSEEEIYDALIQALRDALENPDLTQEQKRQLRERLRLLELLRQELKGTLDPNDDYELWELKRKEQLRDFLDGLHKISSGITTTFEIIEGITIEVGKMGASLLIPGPADDVYMVIVVVGKLKKGVKAVKGIYQVTAKSGKTYVGQSKNIGQRLGQHVNKGKVSGKAAEEAKVTPVNGDKVAREMAEQKRVDDLGGIERLENQRNPIGPGRRSPSGP